MAIDDKALASLASELQGDVLLPGSTEYEEHRASFNGLIDRRPVAIALVDGVDDVVAALAFGRSNGLPIGVRGGGHSVAGHGVVEAGIVIDLRRQRSVEVDPAARTARVAGGATWEDFDTAAQRHGLAVTGGTFVDTGVAGLTLGGGIGFLMGIAGLTCDNLIGAELVTADARVIQVNEADDPDLLWALRGGGGNFGVVTRLDFRLFEVGTIYGDSALLRLGDGAVIGRLRDVQREAPDTFTAISYVANRPEVGPSIRIHVASLGDEAATRRRYDEILGDAEVIDADFRPITYAEVQGFAGMLPFGLRHYWKSTFVADLTPDVIRDIVDLVNGRPEGNTGFLLEPLNGAARRYGFDHAAFPQRVARYHVSALGIWQDPAIDEREISWVREAHRRITAGGTAGTYVNYITPDEPVDRARSAYPPEVLERLRRVKRRLDPENVFRSNLNIAPAD
jgi:FAD/FMN-containing dehydrogenase